MEKTALTRASLRKKLLCRVTLYQKVPKEAGWWWRERLCECHNLNREASEIPSSQEAPLNTAQIPSKCVFSSSAPPLMASLLPCGHPFRGDPTLPETLVSQLLASWAPQRGLLQLPEHGQCLGHKLCGSCTGRAWLLPPSQPPIRGSCRLASWAQHRVAQD